MESRRKHLDDLFEIALVLLGILSAAEFQYFLTTEQENVFAYALRVSTVPFTILIISWLLKELLADLLSPYFKMLFTEYCWALWSFTLFFYLLLLVPSPAGTYLSFGLSLLLIYTVEWAYYRVSPVKWGDRSMYNYYKSWIWAISRFVVFIGTYGLLILITRP